MIISLNIVYLQWFSHLPTVPYRVYPWIWERTMKSMSSACIMWRVWPWIWIPSQRHWIQCVSECDLIMKTIHIGTKRAFREISLPTQRSLIRFLLYCFFSLLDSFAHSSDLWLLTIYLKYGYLLWIKICFCVVTQAHLCMKRISLHLTFHNLEFCTMDNQVLFSTNMYCHVLSCIASSSTVKHYHEKFCCF